MGMLIIIPFGGAGIPVAMLNLAVKHAETALRRTRRLRHWQQSLDGLAAWSNLPLARE